MLNFIKENSYAMVKMFVNQIGMTIFGLLMSMATVSSPTLLTLAGLFSILFYLGLLYTMTWTLGAKDKIRVDGQRAAAQPYKGALMSIGANSINFLLGILMVIGYFCITDYSASTPVWAANLYGVSNAIARLLQAMYIGIIRLYVPNSPLIFLVTPLPAVLICGFGYYMGLKNRRILKAFGINPPEKKHE